MWKNVSVLFIVVFFLGCQGGSSSSITGPSSFAPVLKTGYYYPSSVKACSYIYYEIHITFEDADGDMNGGYIKYTYENTTVSSLPFTEEWKGKTSGSTYISGTGYISCNKGTFSIPVWIEDNKGNKSNTLYATLIQY